MTPTAGLGTSEAGGTATFSVALHTAPVGTVTIGLSSSDTTEGTVSPAALTFTPADGTAAKTVTVTGVNDALADGPINYTIETATATGNDPAYSGIDPPDLAVTNADDEGTPTLTIDDAAAVTEGDADTTAAIFTVTLSVPSAGRVTVRYGTMDGTATAGSDYAAAGGTLTFDPGETSTTIVVEILGDTSFESDETFSVALAEAGNATIADGLGVGTIANDDVQPPADPGPTTPPTDPGPTTPPTDPGPTVPPIAPPAPPPPSISIEDVAKIEGRRGRTVALFSVLLSARSTSPVSVDFATTDGTVRAGRDYLARRGRLTVGPGQLGGTIAVLIPGDTVPEPDRRFRVVLTSPSGAALGVGAATGTIVDDDGPRPRLVIEDVRRAEGNGGQASAEFTVLLTRPSRGPVAANYATADDTARAGSDYTARRGRLTIAPGRNRATVAVPIDGDREGEPHERFKVVRSRPAGAAIADGTGVGTILDDD